MNLEWIPIKIRPLTEEEKELEWVVDSCVDYAYDCQLPDDDDEDVLITTSYGYVTIDTFHKDCDGCWFENYEEDVIAWMPLPSPAKFENPYKEQSEW